MSLTVVGNKLPLYQQVAQILRQRIRTGDYSAQQPLPSFRTLANELNVSLCVVQRAIRLLEQERVLVSHHGKAVIIDQADVCERAAITFGLLQPFSTVMQMHVLAYAEQAFSERANFVVTRTTGGDAARERQVAEHLVNNGVRGLLVWPIEESPNGLFFQEMSERVPVVLVDRLMRGATLPAVIHAMRTGGRAIAQHMLEQIGNGRLLALIDRNDLSSYRDLMAGLRDGAAELGRPDDLTIERMPLVDLVKQFNVADFSRIDQFAEKTASLIERGGYTGLFCPQSEFIDFVLVQTGVLDRFAGLKIGTISNPDMNQHTRRYCESEITQWRVNYAQAISVAADLLQQWILRRQRPRGVLKVEMNVVGQRTAAPASTNAS